MTTTGAPPPRFDGAMAGDWTCVPTSTVPCTGSAGRPTLFGGCTGIGLWGDHGENDEPYFWGCANYAGLRGPSTMVKDNSQINTSCTDPQTCDITRNGTTNPTYTERENAIGDTWTWASSFGATSGTWTQRCAFPSGTAPAGACAPTSGSGSCVAAEEDNALSVCSPTEFLGSSMTYNPTTKEMILTGGYNFDPHWKYEGWRLGGGVWAWDDDATLGCRDVNNIGRTGACWRLILSSGIHNVYQSPNYAANCSKVPGDYFRGASTTVLHGGAYHAMIVGGEGDNDGDMATGTCPASQYGTVLLDQTWLWIDSGNPAAPESGTACWDGGKKYSTSCWVQVAAPLPTPRRDAPIAFDASRSRTVLQGGYNAGSLSDTWTYGDS
jgi:hypothetical protein